MENLINEVINSTVEYKLAVLASITAAIVLTVWFAFNTKKHNAKYKNRESR